MNTKYEFLISFWVDWVDCIQSPLVTCRRILDSAISDKEKILFAFHTWFIAFLLSLSLEIPIYYNYGIKLEKSFIFSYCVSGFIILIIYSFLMHFCFLVFRIKSKFIETLVIYTSLMGAYSPFILLLGYPSIFYNVLLIKAIKDKHIEILGNIHLFNDIIKKVNYNIFIVITSSFRSLLNTILLTIIAVLMSYAIIERYNSSKFRTLLSITSIQMSLVPYMVSFLIKDIILFMYMIK